MNILVTGAMGFIASNLIGDLLNQGHSVLGIDNLSKASINPTDRIKKKAQSNWKNFKFYSVDICDYTTMATIIAANFVPDAIIHLAAVGSVPLSFNMPSNTMKSNVFGFSNMLELLRIFEIKRFIFASSSSVYGSSSINPRVEGQEGKSLSPYAMSKKINEEMAILLTPMHTHFIGLRFFNVYGPGQSLNGHYSPVIPKFIIDDEPTVYGDGFTKRDFTYVDDVSDAIIKCLKLNRSAIMNIGAEAKISLNEILSILGKKDKAVYKDFRNGDIKESYSNSSLAKELINWTANVKFSTGLEITKNFYNTEYKK